MIAKDNLSKIKVGRHNIDQVINSILKKDQDPEFIVIDLFCGAGGTTTGFKMAGQSIAMVVACVNHDAKAIISHWRNYKEVVHFEEDMRLLDLYPLIRLVEHYRKLYPNAKLILWASLECTNFSKAKGGQPRDADSRTLADHLERYILALDPDYVQIENVVEFMSWGPLDSKGKPVSRKNGQDWMRWRKEICEMGYYDEWRELNSANYGAYTSRNRLFGCFAKIGLPIAWPEATHSKNPSKFSMYGDLEKWKAVKEVLDFEDEGESIFTRKKPLSDKTLERIYAGLIKYVSKGDTSFISKYFSGRPKGKVNSVDDPCSTITTFGGSSLVQTKFLQHYYGNGFSTSTNEPCPTLTTKERCALVQPKYFIDQQYGKSKPSNIENIAGTITNNPKLALVKCGPFIMPTNYDNQPKSIEEPLQTITANRKHHYLINPAWGGNNGSIESPCCVIVARQDKVPLYFVQAESGSATIAVFDCDTEVMIRIKQFMSAYGLVDIKMRMLRVPELLKIQGFPENYQLEGNSTDQKKFIGNSVVPKVVKCWVEAMAEKLLRERLKLKIA